MWHFPARRRFCNYLGGIHAACEGVCGGASLVAAAPRLVAARSGATRGDLAASPELLGARTRLAEPRHGRPLGKNALLLAAGFAPLWRETELSAPELVQVRKALDYIMRQQEPFPAVAVDRHWNMLKANDAMMRLTEFLVGPLPPDAKVNLADALVAPDVLRPFLVNWEDVVRYFVRSVEADAAADGTPESAELLDRLLAYKGVREVLKKFSLEIGASPVLPMHFRKHDVSLQLFTTIATLGTPQEITAQELRVESFFPMNDETARKLRSWAAKRKSRGA
jgi:hypothetical protein